MVTLKKIFQIGYINTLRLNYRYFGFYGIFHPYILASKSVKIKSLGGTVRVPENAPVATVSMGFNIVSVFDTPGNKTIWDNNGEIVFKGKAGICQGTQISNSGRLTFGDQFMVTANSTIICQKAIEFGSEVLLSWDILIMDTDFHKIFENENENHILNEPKPIQMGNHVWIGCGSTILKGSVLPDDAVIAAGSLISGDYSNDAHKIIAGQGKILKENIQWKM